MAGDWRGCQPFFCTYDWYQRLLFLHYIDRLETCSVTLGTLGTKSRTMCSRCATNNIDKKKLGPMVMRIPDMFGFLNPSIYIHVCMYTNKFRSTLNFNISLIIRGDKPYSSVEGRVTNYKTQDNSVCYYLYLSLVCRASAPFIILSRIPALYIHTWWRQQSLEYALDILRPDASASFIVVNYGIVATTSIWMHSYHTSPTKI